MLLVANDDELNKKITKYTNTLFSYGYKYYGLSDNDKAHIFIYDISDYKDNPDWLNNKNWPIQNSGRNKMKDIITNAISNDIKYEDLSVEGTRIKIYCQYNK